MTLHDSICLGHNFLNALSITSSNHVVYSTDPEILKVQSHVQV